MQRSIAFGLIFVGCTFVLAPRLERRRSRGSPPEVGAPGDTVLISGTNLGGTSTVRFGANVGGFAGFWVVQVTPVLVTPTLVIAVVPVFGNFLPGGFPLGSIRRHRGLRGRRVRQLATVLLPRADGRRPRHTRAGHDARRAERPPRRRVPDLRRRARSRQRQLHPHARERPPVLDRDTRARVAGHAAGNGLSRRLRRYNLQQPFQLLSPSFTVNASGDVAWNLPIPGGPLNVTIAVVWVVVDPVTGAVGISDGLKMTL